MVDESMRDVIEVGPHLNGGVDHKYFSRSRQRGRKCSALCFSKIKSVNFSLVSCWLPGWGLCSEKKRLGRCKSKIRPQEKSVLVKTEYSTKTSKEELDSESAYME
jgi:hypothetical protein